MLQKKILKRPDSILNEYPRKGGDALTATHYCPGCGHGIVHKLIGEAVDDLKIQDRTVMLSPVGCAVFAYYYFDFGHVQAAHGRAPAVGTGISRANDHSIVISYQGDGDLASIGLNETLQAANRGEKMAVIFINNTVYGMTGGQMAPTTLVGEKTVTSPEGRDVISTGHPIRMCELIANFEAPVYIERTAVSDIKNVKRTRRAIRKALTIQKEQKGYAFVEILSSCDTNLHMTIDESDDFVNTEMTKTFPLRVFKDQSDKARPIIRKKSIFEHTSINDIYTAGSSEDTVLKNDPDFKEVSIKIAGFGGQGVQSLGNTLVKAAYKDGRHVSLYQSYGPEKRGGTSNCTIVISGKPVNSPVIDNPGILIAMNKPSFEKFAPSVKKGGTVIYEENIGSVQSPEHVRQIAEKATEKARSFGNIKAANTVLLAKLLKEFPEIISKESLTNAIRENLSHKPKLADFNIKLFYKTYES